MKVLHINTVFGYGSTGRFVFELASALTKQGDEYLVAYGQNTTSAPNCFMIGHRIEHLLHNLGSRLFGKQGYFSKRATISLIRHIEQIEPDVLHLSNLHGNYLNLGILFNYLAKTDMPVVWTLHDCWAFTGKCAHYTKIGCYRWQTHCSHCPQVKEYPPSFFLDRSEQMFSDKKRWFTSVKNMTIIPVSNWLAGEVKKSFLSKYPIIPTYNWVDRSVFKPSPDDVRGKYGIPQNKFVILGVSAGWSAHDSKIHDFIHLARLVSQEMQIVLIGSIKGPVHMPSNILHIPYIHNTSQLAKIYSMADVYIHFSLEDTFGMVIAEALSCGTPAIVYDSTACPEILGAECGYVVGKNDLTAVCSAINKIKCEGKNKYSARCQQHASTNFDMVANIEKIIQLYESIITL